MGSQFETEMQEAEKAKKDVYELLDHRPDAHCKKCASKEVGLYCIPCRVRKAWLDEKQEGEEGEN